MQNEDSSANEVTQGLVYFNEATSEIVTSAHHRSSPKQSTVEGETGALNRFIK